MLTPIDIQNKEFIKSFGGYAKGSVDEFMSEIAKEYERMYKENLSYKDKITVLNDSLRQYKTMEESLQNTLIIAQSTAEEVKKNAQEKANVMLADAKQKSEQMIFDADQKVLEITRKAEELKSQYKVFKSKLNSLLDFEKEQLEEFDK